MEKPTYTPLISQMRELLLIIAFFVSSCIRAPHDDIEKNSAWIQSRIGEQIGKEVSPRIEVPTAVQEKIRTLLQHTLSIDEVVQIALCINYSLKATFQELGTVEADVLEAGLFTNPFFDAYVRFPNRSSSPINTQFSLTASVLDLFLIPLREKSATFQLEKTKAHIAHHVVSFASKVEQAFYRLQHALYRLHLQKQLVDIEDAVTTLANKQYDAGNVTALFLNEKKGELERAKQDVVQTKIEIAALRRRLEVFMGLSAPNTHWMISLSVPHIPKNELKESAIESIALANRFDILEAERDIEYLISVGAEKKWWSHTNAKIGISTEKETDGTRITGPLFGLSIPLFNSGQADRKRLVSQIARRRAEAEALKLDVGTKIRALHRQITMLRKNIQYCSNVLLPLHTSRVEEATRQYNVMTYGVYDLVHDIREKLHAEMQYVDTIYAYWTTRSMLEGEAATKLKPPEGPCS